MPGRVHRARPRRVVLLRARRRPARAASCSARTRPRATSSSSGIRRSTEIGRHLGAAIGSLVNLFDPDVVVIGGGFGVAAGELLLEPAREVVAARGARAGAASRAARASPSSGRSRA